MNKERAPVLITFTSPADEGSDTSLIPSVLIDGKSTKRVYINYPQYISYVTMQAHAGDELKMVNGRLSQDLRPTSPPTMISLSMLSSNLEVCSFSSSFNSTIIISSSIIIRLPMGPKYPFELHMKSKRVSTQDTLPRGLKNLFELWRF